MVFNLNIGYVLFEKMKDKEEKMFLDIWVMEWLINNVLVLVDFVL